MIRYRSIEGVEDGGGLECRQHDVGGAHREAAEHEQHQFGAVVHRCHVQVPVEGVDAERGHRVADPQQPVVIEQRTLRFPGGAGGVDDHAVVVLAHLDLWVAVRHGGRQLDEIVEAVRAVQRKRRGSGRLLQLGQVPHRRDGVPTEQQHRRAGVLEQIRQLPGRGPRVERGDDRADLERAVQREEEAVGVRRQHRHAVALLHAEGQQRVGVLVDFPVELPVAALDALEDQRGPVRVAACVQCQLSTKGCHDSPMIGGWSAKQMWGDVW